MAAWLLLQVEGIRQHGGNLGYEDQLGVVYRCDATVPNHAAVHENDRILLWDKAAGLLGISFVDHVESGPGIKTRLRCRNCGTTQFKERTTKEPRYRCYRCHAEFDDPISDLFETTIHSIRYEAGWLDLSGRMNADDVRALARSPESQHAIRQADELKLDAVFRTGEDRLIGQAARTLGLIGGGHREATVRVRIGQAAFRAALLRQFGAVCAFSGPQPSDCLDAAHLYSYATFDTHSQHAGFLVRADLHRLFDRGLIVVDEGLRIRVAPDVAESESYAHLDGQLVAVDVGSRARALLADHHNQWQASHR